MPAGDDDDLDALLTDAPAETDPAGASATEGEPAAAEAPAPDVAEEKAEETPATPARPERPRGPKKPWWDVYTSMLALTLLAILLGCVFLAMELSRYNFETSPTTTLGATAGAGG